MKSVKLKMQDYLRNMPLFSKLAEAELDQIAASTFKLQVPGGTTILKQGEECVGFYVVIGGRIRFPSLRIKAAKRLWKFSVPVKVWAKRTCSRNCVWHLGTSIGRHIPLLASVSSYARALAI